ncbi:ABC transporter substrate-binding protein, partial [Paenibacillus sp. MCAF20]
CTNNNNSPASSDATEKPRSDNKAENKEEGKGGGGGGGGTGTIAEKEAPMLAKLVADGSLPPLAERLPVQADVMVEPVVEQIGQYGGDWTMAWTGPGDKWSVGQPTEEALFRFNKDG